MLALTAFPIVKVVNTIRDDGETLGVDEFKSAIAFFAPAIDIVSAAVRDVKDTDLVID